jgi:hypothetical protein
LGGYLVAVISEDTLTEILAAYAGDERLPSPRTVQELADAAGKSEQAVKNEYKRLFQEVTETEDDPWGMPEI